MQQTLLSSQSPLSCQMPCPLPKKKWICNCSTRILGFLPVTGCSLFLVVFPVSNQGPSRNRFIYCNCLICTVPIYTSDPKQQPNSLPALLQALPEQILFIKTELLVYSMRITRYSTKLSVQSVKTAWHCIRLHYNAGWYK